MSLTINIKNMVCQRCNLVVSQIFSDLGIELLSVDLGQAVVVEDQLSGAKLEALDNALQANGFERIDDKKGGLLERMKTLIIKSIHHQDHFNLSINWSDFLADELNYDYSYLSTLFSSVSGITLEQYIIRQKIEKAKEYLIYGQLSVKEIAFKLGYSSVAHLSTQFKKVTGMTPSRFKSSRPMASRKPLDNIM
ncbi:MAG: AraC family transcriptional regulator [Reichenbachiella sp.]|uniref:helix-turn-helix domain-containing protein n=1 Tax=Reichenbachiella sp. TaxID=2184521 RepID=UPI0032651100